MTVESSDKAARILALEREAYRLYHQLVGMSTWRARGLEEGLAMVWTGRRRSCITSISGQVQGCDTPGTGDFGIADATVRIVGHTSGIEYGTFIADDPEGFGINGWYLAELFLASDDTTLDFYVGGPSGAELRFDDTILYTFPFTITHCVSNVVYLKAVAAADYIDFNEPDGDFAPCVFPLAKVLSLQDSVYGNCTLTWNGTSGLWQGCNGSVAYPGYPAKGCAAVTTAYHYRFIYDPGPNGFRLEVRYPHTAVNPCPTANNCAAPILGTVASQSVTTTYTCPNPATSTKFSTAFGRPTGPIGNADTAYPGFTLGGVTITVFEP